MVIMSWYIEIILPRIFFRRDLGQVQRCSVGSDADGQTQQHARNNQDFNVRRRSGEQRTGDEQDSADHQAFFTTQLKGEPAAADSADGRAKHHGADHPFLSVCGNLKLVGNEG
ncbi:Uncharacterised protein [Salmonella sp. NCTC 11881]|nr:Uncharacterised protein [Salmonella sp. NCTC 11881]